MEMSTADEIHEAFGTVDHFLLTAAAAAPAVALLLARAQERGITERQLAAHLGLNATVVMWLLKLAPDTTANRIDLEGDLGEVLLRWARRV